MPGRPTKAWFEGCVRGVKRAGGAKDPAAVCGATWARKSRKEKRLLTMLFEGPRKGKKKRRRRRAKRKK